MAFNPPNYNPASFYYSTPSFDNNQFLDLWNPRPIPKLASDLLFTIPPQYEYRPDLLAYDLYNNAALWWVFAARNPNRLGPDPYFNFKTGVGIYLPTMDTLRTVLGI